MDNVEELESDQGRIFLAFLCGIHSPPVYHKAASNFYVYEESMRSYMSCLEGIKTQLI